MADFDPVSYIMGAKAGSGGGGSSTLTGLTDVDISNPSDGQTLVYNATTGKWENGAGGGGGVFKTLGTISAATVPMTYNSEQNVWMGTIVTDLELEASSGVRNFHVTLNGTDYAFPAFNGGDAIMVDEETQLLVGISPGSDPVQIMVGVGYASHEQGQEPIVTNVSGEYYGASDELAILIRGGK